MQMLTTSFIAAMSLAVAGHAFAVEKKPCGPSEQEIVVNDGTTTCIKVYGARPETNERLAYHIPTSAQKSATTNW